MEKQSEHPLATAIVRYFKDEEAVAVENFECITGKGIQTEYKGEIFRAGNERWMEINSIEIPAALNLRIGEWLKLAKTVIYFSDSRKLLAAIAIADKIKPTSATAVQQLKETGIEVYVLTGDNRETASAVAQQSGISHFKAGLSPVEKGEFVGKLQKEGNVVAMVGDGINDSHALAKANVSIAMGKGSDIAMEVDSMTIISSDLLKVPQAIQLSKQTVKTIKQNLFWAFIYNLVGIPVAAGILYPFIGFLLNPMIAGLAMAMSSISFVSNSLRLKWIRLDRS